MRPMGCQPRMQDFANEATKLLLMAEMDRAALDPAF